MSTLARLVGMKIIRRLIKQMADDQRRYAAMTPRELLRELFYLPLTEWRRTRKLLDE